MRYSIIVPIYNANEYLRECLDSVLSQTFDDWECVCVDDASDDTSPFVLDEYAERDSRFRIIHQRHAGVGMARNVGIDAANGDYIVFLDADDTLLPDALEGLTSETADIVSFLPLKEAGVFDSLAGNMIAWNAIYRSEVLTGVRFPNLVNCEDLVFAAEAYARAKTIVVGVARWYHHRVVSGSAYNSHSWRRVGDSWKSIGMMARAFRPALTGMQEHMLLARKLAIHFILHVAAEVPRATMSSMASWIRKTFTFNDIREESYI